MSKDKVLRYREIDLPRQSGEVARIRVLKGKDVGANFVIKVSSFTIGRGEEVDLLIADPKASRSHARVDFTKEGWIVSDLGSANGIFFQGEYIRKFGLKSGEHFTVGETILEFIMSQEDTRVLTAPIKSAQEVATQDIAFAQQKLRVKNLSQGASAAKSATAQKKNPRTLILLALGAAAYLYLDQEEAAKQKVPVKKVQKKEDTEEEGRSLASYLPNSVPKEVQKTAEQYYAQGFREYLAGNYLRAKDSFQLALQVNPAHDRARHYLANAEKENNDEIKRLINAGRKAKLVGRNSEAKGYFETAMRHLFNDRSNPDYVECEEALKSLKAGGKP